RLTTTILRQFSALGGRRGILFTIAWNRTFTTTDPRIRSEGSLPAAQTRPRDYAPTGRCTHSIRCLVREQRWKSAAERPANPRATHKGGDPCRSWLTAPGSRGKGEHSRERTRPARPRLLGLRPGLRLPLSVRCASPVRACARSPARPARRFRQPRRSLRRSPPLRAHAEWPSRSPC